MRLGRDQISSASGVLDRGGQRHLGPTIDARACTPFWTRRRRIARL